jgi:hypothetical protein
LMRRRWRARRRRSGQRGSRRQGHEDHRLLRVRGCRRARGPVSEDAFGAVVSAEGRRWAC